MNAKMEIRFSETLNPLLIPLLKPSKSLVVLDWLLHIDTFQNSFESQI